MKELLKELTNSNIITSRQDALTFSRTHIKEIKVKLNDKYNDLYSYNVYSELCSMYSL